MGGIHAKHRHEAACDAHRRDPLGLRRAHHREVFEVVALEGRKHLPLPRPELDLVSPDAPGRRDAVAQDVLRLNERGRVSERGRTQEQCVKGREDDRGGADRESDRQHGRGGDTRMLPEPPHGVADVLPECVHGHDLTTGWSHVRVPHEAPAAMTSQAPL